MLYNHFQKGLQWHSRGQRFDPAYLHQKDIRFGCPFSFVIVAGKNRWPLVLRVANSGWMCFFVEQIQNHDKTENWGRNPERSVVK